MLHLLISLMVEKALVPKDLLNSEYKVSVKMSELDLITFVGISES